MEYEYSKIEKKWQAYWEENKTFQTDVWDFSKPKYYVLDMFPYPSGVGLHAGHPEGYTATDIMSRMKRMQGYNVLHPMGYDSFGLPAEQYAVDTGHHPNGFTQKNIETFSKQLRELGFDYDWSKMTATSDPEFYKWTQWIFKKLWEAGYARRIEMPVNWCEALGTVLANDEVIDGKSERGGYPVEKRMMMQWVIDQPAFAEKLLEGLDEIDWPESTKEIQRNWIGKSTGVEVDFQLVGGGSFSIYTTCIETIYGITFMVLAPDGKIAKSLLDRVENREEVQAYMDEAAKKSEIDRTDASKTKTGCRLQGIYAINPVNGREVPVFIGDFVLGNYGTGAVMAVPSHDQRDFEYAVAHNIPMIQVIEGRDVSERAFEKQDYLGKGCRLVNSEEFTGLTVEEAKEAITAKLEKLGVARRKNNYHFREWIFARQRYWGEPVPCVYTDDGKTYFLPDEELPLVLPELEDYKGRGGKAPLENAEEWKHYDKNGIKGLRETSTMPGSAGSSWYYMRYIDPHNDQGMILGENGIKMGKRFPEFVVNPSDIVREYGADTLRLYEMFMGPLEVSKPWSTTAVAGAKKFINRVWNFFTEPSNLTDTDDGKLTKVYHQTVKKVTSDFEALAFNTAIAQMMVFINEVYKAGSCPRAYAEGFIKMMSCITPHVGEEMWQILGHDNTIAFEPWPVYDEEKCKDSQVTIAVQVNGKMRGTVVMHADLDNDTVVANVCANEKIAAFLEKQGGSIVKTIVVKNKLVNLIVK